MDIKQIVEANIGTSAKNGELRVNFKKTVNIRQYETEVVEASLTVPLAPEDVGPRYELIEAIAFAKVEYGVLFSLLAAGRITQAEFDQRKSEMVLGVETLSNYLGIPLSDLSGGVVS